MLAAFRIMALWGKIAEPLFYPQTAKRFNVFSWLKSDHDNAASPGAAACRSTALTIRKQKQVILPD
jgi:hypothetical protein